MQISRRTFLKYCALASTSLGLGPEEWAGLKAALATETDFLSALPFLERCVKALVIDAMDAGRPPGTLYYCRSADLAESGQRHSLHGLGLLGTLEFLDAEHRPEVRVLGVQPGRRGLGLALSLDVASVLPEVVRAAHRIIGAFGRTDAKHSRSRTSRKEE